VPETIVEMREVTKRFARVIANDRASFAGCRGEIHALVGENGAGKSTLMRILYGMFRPDGGRVCVHGAEVRFRSVREAIRAGIGLVHQHAEIVPSLSVAENVVLGAEPVRSGLVDRARARARVAALCAAQDVDIDLDAPASDLGVGDAQRVEILRALDRNAEVLILDEPTAILTPQEVAALFKSLRALRDRGVLVILITHRLAEVFELSDRVTVMRAGETIGVHRTSDTSLDALSREIVGRVVPPPPSRSSRPAGAPALRLEHVVLTLPSGRRALDDVSMTVHAHEIVGIVGVEGNGQTELAEIAAGVRRASAGRVVVEDHDLTERGRSAFLAAGVAFVPEDRLDRGLVRTFSISENLLLGRLENRSFGRGFLRRSRIDEHAQTLVREHDVRPPDPGTQVDHLSGGNQQKVVVARELDGQPRVAVVAQPTRGVDIGAASAIHARIRAIADAGSAVVLVSAELAEVLALADRILVLARGRIRGEMPTEEATPEILGALMLGGVR
jgi:simple sugar transport system ATP-binding protein